MNKFLFLLLFSSWSISFASSSPTIITLKSDNDSITFAKEGWEGSATPGVLYEASNRLCVRTAPAHGYPVPIPERRSKFVLFNFSKKSLATPENAGGSFCRYTPRNAVAYLSGMSSDGSQPLIAELEIYNNTNERVVEIFCKRNIEYGKEYLRCRNVNEAYPESASRISLSLSEGVSTIIVHRE
ncbi:MAG: hypothetical protein A4S09_13965 [Proteobacteria bacterium SG_bin7]|nr:MAG: hypothetical protein A4S09_13965 [Proteobacteria bacterium SG_bin7]